MVKYLILLIFSSLSISVFSQKVVKEFYDPWTKTKLMAEYQVNTSGEKHGWFKGYDQQGVLILENNYKNNLYNGLNKEFTTVYGKRVIASEKNYLNGLLHGEYKEYAYIENENLIIKQGQYYENEKEGEWLDLISYVNYEIPESERKKARFIKRKLYFKKGKLNHDDGVRSFIPDGEYRTTFYPSGQTRSIENYQSGLKKGEFKSFYPNGKIEREAIYDESGKILFVKEYHPNGQLRYHEDLRGDDFIYFEFDKDGNETRKSLTIKSNRQQKINRNKERERLVPILLNRADSLANEMKYYEALNLLDKNYNFIKLNALREEGITDDLINSSGYHDKYMVYFNKIDSINNDNNQKILEINYYTEVLSLISNNEDFTELSFEQYKNDFVEFWSKKLFYENRAGVSCNKENFYTETNSQYGGSCFKRALRSSFKYDEERYNEFHRLENFINQTYPILRNRHNIYFYDELYEIYKICHRTWAFYSNNITADEFFLRLNLTHQELKTLVENVKKKEKLTSEISIILNNVEEKLLTKPANKKALNQSLILAKTAFQEKDKNKVSESLISLSNIKAVLSFLMDEKNTIDKGKIKAISKAESLEQIKSILNI